MINTYNPIMMGIMKEKFSDDPVVLKALEEIEGCLEPHLFIKKGDDLREYAECAHALPIEDVVSRFVIWSFTPQGREFWYAIRQDCIAKGEADGD